MSVTGRGFLGVYRVGVERVSTLVHQLLREFTHAAEVFILLLGIGEIGSGVGFPGVICGGLGGVSLCIGGQRRPRTY